MFVVDRGERYGRAKGFNLESHVVHATAARGASSLFLSLKLVLWILEERTRRFCQPFGIMGYP